MYKLAWFTTGRDLAAIELLECVYNNIKDKTIPAKIECLFCNREPGESRITDELLKVAEGYGLPVVCLSSYRFEPKLRAKDLSAWRYAYDEKIIESLKCYEIDLGVLSGYMLITSPLLCSYYKLINLHPAPPGGPKGSWQEVIWELIKNKSERAGAMMHLVTEKLDEGPPICYFDFDIEVRFQPLWKQLQVKLANKTIEEIIKEEGESEPLFKAIREKEFELELPLLITTLKNLAEGKIKIEDRKIYYADGSELPQGLCINNQLGI